ncbi:hypothetical protein [Myroides odoratimimus]|uniref:hypothetical protein n=1 Tax=Myroides odoratimimus TaxID=76832 RepID=UPI0025751AFF|nr:hypothetical protein [Myroides odoratimimus]MDM1499496.1 hypothetical protein [Myroides odoratimimus]
MKKLIPLFLLLLSTVVITSCSSDDNSSNINNLNNVEVVFTKGKALSLEADPFGENMDNDLADKFKYSNVDKVNFTLPKHTEYFTLYIQGSQKQLGGYVKINGKTWEFDSLNGYYSGTYYLSDFR